MSCNFPYDRRIIPPFFGFTDFVPEIPKMYWNVKSQEQRIHAICALIDKLVCYVDMLGDTENETQEALKELISEFEKFKESGFDDYYADQVEKWIAENAAFLFETYAKQVFFGLTSNGYFCAYIPESWKEIEFDTGMQYGHFDYGRLILRYNADGSGVIDNTGRYDDSSTEGIIESINGLERRVAHNEGTLYTELNRG